MNKEPLKSVCDQKNFEEIFNQHSQTLRNYIYYKCGDTQQAEDIVQEAYIKLWSNCAKVFFDKAKSYLYTVANNHFLNDVAHKKVVLEHQKQSVSSGNTNETPQFLLEQEEFHIKLKKAIADLPEKQREVFLLSRIDKKKYSEIAVIVGVSVKAVEKRMSKALLTLKEQIGKV
ncbi:RNA polymerase sigma factor [Tenacibaculum singaporense]|uniref:RNA polymerase sigma factor n=1 Tax=Tenacibaculum singaporense TaxID=2358479 RepID=A0A3Q8RRW8_9FLAO|nr:RNA polymerase sigma factor [Tenacibaculum singaporense]AZJ35658.1 RNA polymerase sigma factor [Tenacibaculum singaporense]RSC92913.1 RNA polymerase sigma factor [Tenacibaculum singaporense]